MSGEIDRIRLTYTANYIETSRFTAVSLNLAIENQLDFLSRVTGGYRLRGSKLKI